MSLSPKRKRSPTKKKNAPTPWFSECPVQEDDPDIEGDDDEALIPGPALVKCSGKDIHLQKAAVNKKLDKYLCILPGCMSFRSTNKKNNALSQESAAASEPPLSLTQDTVESTTMDGFGNHSQNDHDDEKKEDVTSSQSVPAKQRFAENWVSLGNIDDLDSDQPTLSFPLPNGQALQLSGKKVATTTKFLVLSIHPRKGKVTCKHIFDSAVVFGNATLDQNNSQQDDTKSTDEDDNDIVMEDASMLEVVDNKNQPIQHYGSSTRPLGDDQTTTMANAASSMRTSKTLSQTSQQTSRMDDDDSSDNDSTTSSNQQEASSGSEDEFKLKNLDTSMSNPKRRTSRRQSRKSIQYNEDEDNDSSQSKSDSEGSDSDNDTDDDDVQEKPPVKKPQSRSKPKPAPQSVHASRKRKTHTDSKKIFEESSDDESVVSEGATKSLPKQAPSRPRRRSSTKKPINYNEDAEGGDRSDNESDANANPSDSEEDRPKRQRRAPASSSRKKQAKQSVLEVDSSDSDLDKPLGQITANKKANTKKSSTTGFTDSDDSDEDPQPKKATKPAPRKPTVVKSSSSSKKRALDSFSDSGDSDSDVKTNTKKRGRSSETKADSKAKPPKRRQSSGSEKKSPGAKSVTSNGASSSQTPSPRRRKKGGMKRSPAKKIIELDDDGEFKFL